MSVYFSNQDQILNKRRKGRKYKKKEKQRNSPKWFV